MPVWGEGDPGCTRIPEKYIQASLRPETETSFVPKPIPHRIRISTREVLAFMVIPVFIATTALVAYLTEEAGVTSRPPTPTPIVSPK